MNEFLELNSPAEFWRVLDKNLRYIPDKKEVVPFTKSLHRVLAEDIKSPVDLPPFSRSTVDGFAVRARDTAGASASLPVYLNVIGEVLMGEGTELEPGSGEAIKIPTGGMMPRGADSVIMMEYTEYLDENTIESISSVAVGENVVQQGEDSKKNDLILQKGDLIRPQDIGALAGFGITEVNVFARPEIAIISTGDELVPPSVEPAAGEIRDINSYSIGAFLEGLGCKVRQIGIVEDSFAELKGAVEDNFNCDLILISGGSSVGIKDMTIDVINSLGKPGVLMHGVSIKPGKPTILGVISGLPVIGLPGHPASAWTITNILIKPLVQRLKGEKFSSSREDKTFKIEAVLSRNLVSDKGREEYVPVRLLINQDSAVESGYIAEPITGKSSLITTFVEADGFIRIDTYREGVNKDTRVYVQLY